MPMLARTLFRPRNLLSPRRSYSFLAPLPQSFKSLRSNSPPSSFSEYPETQITTLSNGLRVATEELPFETATVQVWIDAGSRFEKAENNGVAHYLEHLKFKGTKNRSRMQLETEVENSGAHLNAYTSREQTVFFASVFRNSVPQAMDILGDILQNSTLDENAIEREREVILRELKEVLSLPEEKVFDRLHETAYRGQSLSRTILGAPKNIVEMDRQQIQDYIKQHYTADRIMVVGAGAVQHDKLVKLSEEVFANLPLAPKEPIVLEPAVFTGSDIRERHDDLKMAYYAIAFETAGHNDKDSVPLLFLQALLGQWKRGDTAGAFSHSDLIAEINRKNCAEIITPFNTQYRDTGLLGVFVACRPHDVNESTYTVLNEIQRLCYDLSNEQVEVARHQLKQSLMSALNGTTSIADEIGRQILCHGRRIHPSEMVARIDDVDTQAIKNCCMRFLNDKDIAVSALGALHELPDYTYMRRRTYWQRF